MPAIMTALSEADREELHLSNMIFLDGECYAFAAALNRITSWPIVGLMTTDPELGYVPYHVGVRDPDGRFRDFRGVVDDDTFGAHFGLRQPYDLRELTLEDLRAIRPVAERMITYALALIEHLWPELPVRINGNTARAHRFAAELEKLCQAHGVWFTTNAGGTAHWPFMTFDDDLAQGIELRPSLTGNTFFFNRHFGRPN